jgi:hypothetical protein
MQGGDDDDLGGHGERGQGEGEGGADKRPSGGDALTGSEVLNHKPPFMGTEQFEARKKEMVKTLMAGIGIARDRDLDEDKLEDPLSQVRLHPAGVASHFLLLFQFPSLVCPHRHARDASHCFSVFLCVTVDVMLEIIGGSARKIRRDFGPIGATALRHLQLVPPAHISRTQIICYGIRCKS